MFTSIMKSNKRVFTEKNTELNRKRKDARNEQQNKKRKKQDAMNDAWCASERMRMKNQSGWPYDKYPDFGWLFRTSDKCVPLHRSLMEKGYCIITVPMWQVDQLRWTLTHCESSDIIPNTKKNFEHPPQTLE